jgi:hypothetical protein
MVIHFETATTNLVLLVDRAEIIPSSPRGIDRLFAFTHSILCDSHDSRLYRFILVSDIMLSVGGCEVI